MRNWNVYSINSLKHKIFINKFQCQSRQRRKIKPAIGNISLLEIINDNVVEVVNFSTPKNHSGRSTMFPHRIIHKYTWSSADGKTQNQFGHILIDRRMHPSLLDV
jgi:hypothetical protein